MEIQSSQQALPQPHALPVQPDGPVRAHRPHEEPHPPLPGHRSCSSRTRKAWQTMRIEARFLPWCRTQWRQTSPRSSGWSSPQPARPPPRTSAPTRSKSSAEAPRSRGSQTPRAPASSASRESRSLRRSRTRQAPERRRPAALHPQEPRWSCPGSCRRSCASAPPSENQAPRRERGLLHLVRRLCRRRCAFAQPPEVRAPGVGRELLPPSPRHSSRKQMMPRWIRRAAPHRTPPPRLRQSPLRPHRLRPRMCPARAMRRPARATNAAGQALG